MSARSERDAAYFTLLRAREEHADLLTYRELLDEELRRLDGFVADTRAMSERLPARLRKPVEQTTRQMLEAVGRRRSVVEDERRKVEQRLVDAQDFVEECEADVARLRG